MQGNAAESDGILGTLYKDMELTLENIHSGSGDGSGQDNTQDTSD